MIAAGDSGKDGEVRSPGTKSKTLGMGAQTIGPVGCLGPNAEAKTAQNKRDYLIFSLAAQESWKNDKGKYEARTE